MSRSGYSDDYDDDDPLALARWRSAVRRATYGKRGQAFLKEMLAALDAMPEKRLIRNELLIDGSQGSYTFKDPTLIVGADELVAPDGTVAAMGEVCAIGAVGRARGLDMSALDPEDTETVATTFNVADALVREIVHWNDDQFDRKWLPDKREYRALTPEERWQGMRDWVATLIKNDSAQASNTEGTGGQS